MRLIPAIDIIDGQCVRLSQGSYDTKKVYEKDPTEVAKRFEDSGIKYLHLVDLDGAKKGQITNWKVLESIANNTDLIIDFGGGIKTNEDIEIAFNAGASQITCGSIAVKNPQQVLDWIAKYGADKLILGADVKDKMIATGGWIETSTIQLDDHIATYLKQGIKSVICTDIATDGMLQGPNLSLYKELLSTFPELKLIASGGVSSIEDLKKLKAAGQFGAIIGKAIYENKISLKELTDFNNA
ncbi:1-(5-phosphoribosyl)-5-[(5-phosphoribosylamino)methylideneamino]imidazole-4-carboxamide isomerase [Fulvivirga lutimaris]|uniref:1-(5-phosphoribosyl)-5-[(5- phosphoribosylamino)methylideneamino]imidazole-4- carboxamide isomerase n=1 Tax=Fulvivirga lutimaris TaxID=1819566 RepID=UPI0012BBFCD6|nr:1-(5-phosphoribosyl)-5-[(5-phosphoribosylamino)methylideneamino]imidazole-4-carboxamide isomerase [Fulvivirga lutimaris]MTI41569.1 1-(5-phosphoribosyl)-5-[(5-phosphoribosylamino)methylideneamino]imidazole-4-carboxamide isomerase [Fulvivirga lutimaris]